MPQNRENEKRMLIWWILKFIILAVFLFMFWRRPSLSWGVGLLTVTSAILLDTFLGTFNRDELLVQFGFFFYIVIGLLMGGAAFWLLSLFLPWQTAVSASATPPNSAVPAARASQNNTPHFSPGTDEAGTAFDRQMIYEEIRDRLGHEDVLDLLFDIGINDNEVMNLQ